jgi:uncharacterized protein DUF5996
MLKADHSFSGASGHAPETTFMAFLESTYRAAADLGGWDRQAVECPMGELYDLDR